MRMETFPPIPGLLVHHESVCNAMREQRVIEDLELLVRECGGNGMMLERIEKLKANPTYCVIHRPSTHVMSEFKYNWRADRALMERICPHGIGHPDPDDIAFRRFQRGDAYAGAELVHGCDGCCAGAYGELD